MKRCLSNAGMFDNEEMHMKSRDVSERREVK
jgi:hypothetical protein